MPFKRFGDFDRILVQVRHRWPFLLRMCHSRTPRIADPPELTVSSGCPHLAHHVDPHSRRLKCCESVCTDVFGSIPEPPAYEVSRPKLALIEDMFLTIGRW